MLVSVIDSPTYFVPTCKALFSGSFLMLGSHLPSLYVALGDPHSGPLVCVIGTLSTEPRPQPHQGISLNHLSLSLLLVLMKVMSL